MSYAFSAHVAGLSAAFCAPFSASSSASSSASFSPSSSAPNESAAPLHSFALVDVAALRGLRKPLPELVPDAAAVPLFEDTFARSALDLSPLLFALAAVPARWSQQVLALDAVCHHLPVMGLLRSTLPPDALLQHLQSLLLVEAESTAYLLRFADTQMLAAVNTVFTPPQRARFFHGLQAWFTVDHEGQLCDQADAHRHPQGVPAGPVPLQLDTPQTHALLDATAVPALASQLRHLEASFADSLSHAQQTEFIINCLATAQDAGIRDDTGLVMWSLRRWHAELARTA